MASLPVSYNRSIFRTPGLGVLVDSGFSFAFQPLSVFPSNMLIQSFSWAERTETASRLRPRTARPLTRFMSTMVSRSTFSLSGSQVGRNHTAATANSPLASGIDTHPRPTHSIHPIFTDQFLFDFVRGFAAAEIICFGVIVRIVAGNRINADRDSFRRRLDQS